STQDPRGGLRRGRRVVHCSVAQRRTLDVELAPGRYARRLSLLARGRLAIHRPHVCHSEKGWLAATVAPGSSTRQAGAREKSPTIGSQQPPPNRLQPPAARGSLRIR